MQLTRRPRRPRGWNRPGFASWLHTSCNCCCPATVELTLAGIDGNGCVCYGPSAGLYRSFAISGIDGTYQLTKTSEIGGADPYCIYTASPFAANSIVRTRYSDAACTSFVDTTDLTGSVSVAIYRSGGGIRYIYVGGTQMEAFCSNSGGFNSFDAAPGLARATNHANANQAVPCVWYSASGTGNVA